MTEAGDIANVAALVRRAAGAHPDKSALIFQSAASTWAELDATVDRAAHALQRLGLARGDRVALVLGNTPEFAVCYFGALRAGLVAVPMNTTYTAAEIEKLLLDSGAALVCTAGAAAPMLAGMRAALPNLDHVVVAGAPQAGALTLSELLAGAPAEPFPERGGGEDLAVLIYTSGTSGRPRGAMLSHRALLANLEQTARIAPPVMTPEDVVLLVLPLFHIYGLNPGLGAVAFHGATGVLVERFDPVETLSEVRSQHVTTVVGAPPMYVAWSMLPDVGDAFSSARLLLSGSAPLPPEVLGQIREATGHHIFEGYGLTETAPVLTTTLMSEVAKPGSIGRPVPGLELLLLDPEGDPVDAEDPGEIVVRGPNLFSGYWPDGDGGPDPDGWFRTGDVAYADDEDDLHLVDRRKELVLVSGFNVYPREVEDTLLRHPAVLEVAVIGIPHPYTGESVKALVVTHPGARPTMEELIEHCARTLARFKCPTAVEFVAELPHGATGKVSKGRLREDLETAG